MSVLRNVLLAGSENRWLRERAVRYPFARRAVKRFMPGETAEEALAAARALGVGAVLTRLGENLKDAGEAAEVTAHYLTSSTASTSEKLDVEISVKPTQLGLDFSREDCENHLRELATRAQALENWVWVDMESTAYTEATLDLYRRAARRLSQHRSLRPVVPVPNRRRRRDAHRDRRRASGS